MLNWSKLQGGQALPAGASKAQLVWAMSGGFVAIVVLAYLAKPAYTIDSGFIWRKLCSVIWLSR